MPHPHDNIPHSIDPAVVGSYVASGTAFSFGALSVNEWVMIGGLVIAALTYGTSWYYKHKHYILARRRRSGDKP